MDSFDADALTVENAGEAATLRAIFDALRSGALPTQPGVFVGPGDDAAVLHVDGALAVSSDAMVEGVDFRLDWTSGYQLGWKLAATNLSDIAAMGAWPTGLTVTVCAPSHTRVSLLVEITRGLMDAAQQLAPGCRLVGGDLSQGSELSFAVTALGELRDREAVVRSGARAGDVLAYAGDLGLSGAGLRLLLEHCDVGCTPAQLSELWRVHPELLRAHLQPSPPIALGIAAAAAGATAMMDVSDGLALDASRLAAASDVTVNLESELLDSFSSRTTLEDVLFGGEDHGFLATFPPNTRIPYGFVQIGQVVPRSVDVVLDGEPLEPRGWDPFSAHPKS